MAGSKYRRASALFNSKRYDIQYVYSGGVDYSLESLLGLENTKLALDITHIDNLSNHALNERKRTIYGLQVVKEF